MYSIKTILRNITVIHPLYSKSVFAAIRPDQPAPVLVCIDNNETDWSIYHSEMDVIPWKC